MLDLYTLSLVGFGLGFFLSLPTFFIFILVGESINFSLAVDD